MIEIFRQFLTTLYNVTIAKGRWLMYLQGLGQTLLLASITCVIGVLLGLLVASAKISAAGSKNPVLRVLNALCEIYTTVIRGTPLMVQLLIIFSIRAITSNMMVCVIGFGLNSGAYVSEIFRGGINSVDIGQTEAGRSLGLSRWQTMWKIVLPQAVKNILPALFNEFIVLVKETSVAGYVGLNDLTKIAGLIKGLTFNPLPLFVAAALYLLVTYILTLLHKALERRMARSDRG